MAAARPTPLNTESAHTEPALSPSQFLSDPVPQGAAHDLPRFRKDRISYIADLIAELEVMSSAAGCGTLAGILRLAYAEAHQQLLSATQTIRDQTPAR
jgi:hypothetical protein